VTETQPPLSQPDTDTENPLRSESEFNNNSGYLEQNRFTNAGAADGSELLLNGITWAQLGVNGITRY